MAQEPVTRAKEDREPVDKNFEWKESAGFQAEFVTPERQKKAIIEFPTVRVVSDDESERWLSLSMEALEGEW